MFEVCGTPWALVYCKPNDIKLRRPDGVYTLGVADNTCKTVFISNSLSPYMFEKVLIHEMCHCYVFETGYMVDAGTEEIIADFVSIYGLDIIDAVYHVMEEKYKLCNWQEA